MGREDIRDDVFDYLTERMGWGDRLALSLNEIEEVTGHSPGQVGHVLGNTLDPHEGIGWSRLPGTSYRFVRLPPVGMDLSGRVPDEDPTAVTDISWGDLGDGEYLLAFRGEGGDEHAFILDEAFIRGLHHGVEEMRAVEGEP